MAGLADTISELLTRSRASPSTDRPAGLREVVSFGADPGALRMWLYVPEALPTGAPLVVVLHGCGQTAPGYASGAGWLTLADRLGFAVLCPEQVRANNVNLCFNWFEEGDVRRGAGEAASIAQMVVHALAAANLDPTRVFVTGLSAGGAMTTVMLATYPELFVAGAVVAGLPYGAASGVSEALGAMRRMPTASRAAWGDRVRAAAPPPVRWPHVAIWYGDGDTTVTPEAARALVLQWCDVHGVDRAAASYSTNGRRTRVIWRRADGAPGVELNRVAGLGHGTPIAVEGEDGCGAPAPWILEAGISSSAEIARSWGLAPERTGQAADDGSAKSNNTSEKGWSRPSSPFDIDETIAQALRSAGLTR